ncbi:MAG: amidase [Janthinobacterium lividum]
MYLSEYLRYDAIGLARLVRTKQVSSTALLDCALEHTQRVNPKINAVINFCEDAARQAIKQGLPDGPLRGVPFLVKDGAMDWAGLRTTSGSRALANAPIVGSDSPLAAAIRGSGVVMFGKTNLPEFGLAVVTEPQLFGPTRNPWNSEFSPGGSSGGAAAAVASGFVPAAHGNDGAGSLRIPAAWCGVFTMKTTRGRISMAPGAEGLGGLTTQGFLSRTVRDNALLLDLSCQPQIGDPYWRDPPSRSFLSHVASPSRRLRVGVLTDTFPGGDKLDPECRATVDATSALLAELGHHVEPITMNGDWQGLYSALCRLIAASAFARVTSLGEERGAPFTEAQIDPVVWLLVEEGRKVSLPEYIAARGYLQTFSRNFAATHAAFDVLMTSTTPCSAPRIGAPQDTLRDLRGTAANTSIFNITGQPAMSLPLGMSSSGTPLGAQLSAAAGEEGLLYSLAAEIEAARPWSGLAPLATGETEA